MEIVPIAERQGSKFESKKTVQGTKVIEDVGINLYKMHTDGTGKISLLNQETENPWISIDGDWIYYSITLNGEPQNYKMRMDGTEKAKDS
jgi:Tol biopolymer transport system component